MGSGLDGLKRQCGTEAFSGHSSGTGTTSVALVSWKAMAELPLTPAHTEIGA